MIHVQPPSYDQVVAAMAAAEQDQGWLNSCEEHGRFLAPTRELISTLAEQLRELASGPILEVCAGDGELSAALGAEGVNVITTDTSPPPGSSVIGVDALEALSRYRPATVLGCFVPFDAGVNRAVLAAPSVKFYLVLNARLGGQLGDEVLWHDGPWFTSPLPEVSRWMICRHDVWMGPDRPIIQHGEAWLFRKRKPTSRG